MYSFPNYSKLFNFRALDPYEEELNNVVRRSENIFLAEEPIFIPQNSFVTLVSRDSN